MNIHMMYDIIPIVANITIIDSKPMALPNIKSNQNAIVKSSFADVSKFDIPKLPRLLPTFADLDQGLLCKWKILSILCCEAGN